MSNRWSDGFGRYGGDKTKMLNGSSGQAWAQVDGDWDLSNANPRTGSWNLRLDGANAGRQNVRRVFGAPLTSVIVGFAICVNRLPASETSGTSDGGTGGICIGQFHDASNGRQIRMMLGSDGAIEFRRDTVVLDRTIPIIGAGAYQHLELYAAASNTTGAIELRVDEVTRMNLTGIDTVATANVEFSQISLYREALGDDSVIIDIADFFCNDGTDDGSGCNTFVGDVKSGWFPVDADTAQADFTLSAGVSGYPLLNETPPNDTTYITTAASTAESDFGLADLPANTSEVLTVRPAIRPWKDDAGTCTVAPNMKSAAVKGSVSSQPVATAPGYVDSNVPLDPNTGAPWTPAGFNAALLVAERTA